MQTTTLANACSATEQTISLAGGRLTVGQVVALDAEYCEVLVPYNDTQAKVQRGINGSHAAAHLPGATVAIGTAQEFLTGPQILPTFGIAAAVLTGEGPTADALFAAPVGPTVFGLLTVDPSAPADDTWWVVREGTSPTQTVSVKARIGGATVTIAAITE